MLTHIFSVDQSAGTISTYSLTTNIWYDHRGDVIEESDPGGLVTKTQYDGAGREIEQYTTDGGSGTSWADASIVTNDNVLNQVDTQYDANGNVILTINRDRFHNETTLGALGNATTAPLARVSYVAYYYDAADRPTATVDVGTNGGTAYTRPSSPPSSSATVLVTSTAYNAAGWAATVTDPRGIVTQIDLRQPGPHDQDDRRLHRQHADSQLQPDDRVHLRRRRQHADREGGPAEQRLPDDAVRLRRDHGGRRQHDQLQRHAGGDLSIPTPAPASRTARTRRRTRSMRWAKR